MNQPSGLRNMLRAAAGALPFVPRGDKLPERTVKVDELPIDHTHVAAYATVTGLRYGNNVPLTYPFALTFPTMMSLVTSFDFPFAAMGSIHLENHITQYRPIAVTDTVGVQVHAENLREHRKGLLVDLVTDVNVGNDTAWHQVTTFLHQQRTSLSDEPKPPPQKEPKLPPPSTVLRVTPSQIRRYAFVGGRSQAVRIPHRDCTRNVRCSSRIGQHRGSVPGRGPIFGEVRQALGASGHGWTLRRKAGRRLGSRVAQYRQGISLPDRHRPAPIALPSERARRPASPGKPGTTKPAAGPVPSRRSLNSARGDVGALLVRA
jgi:hypothetical protein